MSSLNDRIPEFEAAIGRFARQRPDRAEPALGAGAPADAADAEMRELAARFEALYFEDAPPPPREQALPIDDFQLDLPEDFRTASHRGHRAAEPKADASDAPRRTPAPEIPPPEVRPRASHEPEVSFEDAMALLRAAEASGKSAAQRSGLADEDESAAAPAAASSARAAGMAPSAFVGANPAVGGESRTRRSQQLWPRLLAVAAIALSLGAGLGYVAGVTPKSPAPRIEVSPQGGAQLRFDYDLEKR